MDQEKQTERAEDDDLISNLPIEILQRILSFIPIGSILLISASSRSWRRLSKHHLLHTTNFDFGEDFAKRHINPTTFIQTLTKILSINVSKKIDKFRLFFNPCNNQDKAKATEWIEFATSRDVEELDLDFLRHIRVHFLSRGEYVLGRNEAFELPVFLFESRSLVTLKLSRCILALPEKISGLGYLQTLCLREVHVTSSMLESLLGCCPVLEVLVLRECGSLNRIRVHNSMLKRLTLYECYNASVVEILAPNIKSLLLSAGHLHSCTFADMSVLEDAFVGTRGDEFGGVLYIFMKIFPQLSQVKALTLYLGHLVPNLIKDFQVTFSKLRELKLLNSSLFGVFSTDVYCFFKHCTCPLLEKVYIEIMHGVYGCAVMIETNIQLSAVLEEEEGFNLEFRKPIMDPVECVFENLRMIELSNYRGIDEDLEIINYFLERAPILKTLILVGPRSSGHYQKPRREDAPRNVEERFLKLLIASPDLNIVFSEDYYENALLSIFKKHHVL